MQCPNCVEEVSDAAIVCPHCRHDLAPSKLVVEENKALQEEIDKLQFELVELRAFKARAESGAKALGRRQAAPGRALFDDLLIYGLLPIALLLIAHLLIIVLWDRPTLYLRIASIVLPIPFGFALIWRERRNMIFTIALGAAVSFLAIFGMLLVMHVNYQDTILPSTRADLIEELQYFTSISLAFITGGLLAIMGYNSPLLPGGRPALLASRLAPLLAVKKRKLGKRGDIDISELIARAQSIQKLVTGVIAVSTTAGSIYTGIHSVLQ
jgi:hypothetical protein